MKDVVGTCSFKRGRPKTHPAQAPKRGKGKKAKGSGSPQSSESGDIGEDAEHSSPLAAPADGTVAGAEDETEVGNHDDSRRTRTRAASRQK